MLVHDPARATTGLSEISHPDRKLIITKPPRVVKGIKPNGITLSHSGPGAYVDSETGNATVLAPYFQGRPTFDESPEGCATHNENFFQVPEVNLRPQEYCFEQRILLLLLDLGNIPDGDPLGITTPET